MTSRRRFCQTVTGIFLVSLLFYKFLLISNTQNFGNYSSIKKQSSILWRDQSLHLCNLNQHLWDNFTVKCINTSTIPAFSVCPYNDQEDIYVSAALLTDGVWEPHMTKVFQEALNYAPNSTVVDIGAHIGYYSLLSAAHAHNVVSVEPVSASVRRLITATNVNNFSEKITVLANAVSNKVEDVELSAEKNNQGAIHVVNGKTMSPRSERVGTSARAITLDHITGLVNSNDVIIKLDIEGYECKAIQTSNLFFDNLHVKYIFMEWKRLSSAQHKHGSPCSSRAVKHMTKYLSSRGYIPYELRYGIPLRVQESTSWRAGDIYWRHEDTPQLKPAVHSNAQTS